jgi:phosphoglycerate dehydrogenase-like enzyme
LEGVLMRVAVLDDYQRCADQLADWTALGPDVTVTFFTERIAPDALVDMLSGFEVIVAMRERTALPRPILERLPVLRLLVTTGMVNAAIDIAYLERRGVVVCGTNGSESRAAGVPTTVEVTWALILSLFKHLTQEDHGLRKGAWQLGMPRNLAGATLGLAGLGRLGAAMVAPARTFGMDVIGWSQHFTDARADELGVTRVDLDNLLTRSDVLSIHLVLSDRTRGLFGNAELAKMQRTAVLVNTSRGPIVEERALIEALRAGTIAGAGLDVYDREPLPSDSELLTLENTVLLPHLGYVNEPTLRHMYQEVVEDIAAFRAGESIRVLRSSAV